MYIFSESVYTFPELYAAFPIRDENSFSVSFGIFQHFERVGHLADCSFGRAARLQVMMTNYIPDFHLRSIGI